MPCGDSTSSCISMTSVGVKSSKKAVVIGGGISGLATAALLSKHGWHVTVLEKNETFGGRARVLSVDGFAFDMGPSWYLMPEVFERFFALFGRKPSDYYELVRLNPRYQVMFGDQERVIFTDAIEANAAWFEQIESGAGQKLRAFLSKMERVYQATTDSLMYQDVWNAQTWMSKEHFVAIGEVLGKLKLWESWDKEVRRYFKDERLRKILGFPAVFLGGSPFNTPALYSILTWADFGKGVWYPKGGMGKVVDALVRLAQEQGVELRGGVEATAIDVVDGHVTGVQAGMQGFEAKLVVGATDIPFVETKLLPEEYRAKRVAYWQKKTLGISAVLLYLGVNKRIGGLVHHTIYFSNDWEKNFDEIFTQQILPTDPSFYISARSATDRTIVPPNAEELFVLVPVAAGVEYTSQELDAFSERMLHKVNRAIGMDLEEHLVVKKVFAPADFANDYNAFGGTALGLAHTFDQSLWLRPHNQHQQIKGLYYAGQYTNPGVGVPMALISAEMVIRMVGSIDDEQDRVFKKGSVTYYYSSLFFKGQIKKDVFTLYAYVRVIDDLVDTGTPHLAEFEAYWEATYHAWSGEKVAHPIVQEFVELARRKGFQWDWVEAFWQAMRSDLSKKVYHSYAELEVYMYGSAEVIGLMMAKILDLPEGAMHAAAVQGRAMQYVNFIRDVKEDKELGRNYLGYSVEEERNPVVWELFLKKHIERYWELQKEAEKGYVYIPKNYLIPIKTAADMYSWTAEQIYADPSVVWEKKIKPRKARVLLEVLKNKMLL